MAPNMTLFSVHAILIMATDDGSRILANYYTPPHAQMGATNLPSANPYPTPKEQKAFEKGLLEKTSKSTNDIILWDNQLCLFKTESDVMLYVIGGAEENEILLYSCLLALRDSLNILLKNSTDKRTIVENYDLVSLAVDELVDDGIILETDPVVIAQRVTRPPAQEVGNLKGVELSEEGIMKVWDFAKLKMGERLRQGL